MSKITKFVVGFVFCLPLFGVGGYRFVKEIMWERNVSGHIKRAADANSVELAKSELKVVVDYLNANNIREGYTSVFYTTPDEDVGFWYKNITTCLSQLEGLPTTATTSERDMVLLKLRQTLLDHSQTGEKVTQPSGISIFPFNAAVFLVLCCTLLPAFGGFILVIFTLFD